MNDKLKICLIAIFKNEIMNLKIWLDHYIWQGITKFYLIDNDSNDNPLSILQKYIDDDIVTYEFLPEKHKQKENYNYMFNKYNVKNNNDLIIICDLDEFFYGTLKIILSIIFKLA